MNRAELSGSVHSVAAASDVPHPIALDLAPGLIDELGHLINEIRHQDFARLEEAVEIFARAPHTKSGFPTVRPADCRKIIEAFAAYLHAHRTRFLQNDPVLPERFFGAIERFADSDIRAYPNEVLHLQLLHIEAMIVAGRNEEALALSGPMAERPYLIEGDLSSLGKLFELDTLARLNAGQRSEVDAVALGRLLLLVRIQRRNAGVLFGRFFPMLATTATTTPQYSRLEGIVRFAAKFRLTLRIRKKKHARLLRLLEWPVSVLAIWTLRYIAWQKRHLRLQVLDARPVLAQRRTRTIWGLFLQLWRRAPGVGGDVLVTRAMGGLGDIMMMTPGLKALAGRIGHPVYFATKRQYFPLLENNPDVHLLDIDEIIDLGRFRRWVNLSFCPAGRYESRTVPKVKKGRVELFARAMGVRRRSLNESGWKPVCHLESEKLLQRDRYRAHFQLGDFPVVGVQPYSRDTYKNSPNLFSAMMELAETARIVVFHTLPVPVPAHPNIIQLHGQPMRDTFAAIAACDYFVSVDSGFFHIAAALEIPSVGIFGPTDARIVSRHHPCAVLLEAPEGFICAPCWRNEDLPCKLTGGQVSVCLSAISSKMITTAVQQLAQSYPRRQPSVSIKAGSMV